MTISVRRDSVNRPIVAWKVMIAGTLRPLQTVKVKEGGTLRTVANFAAPLTVSASPNPTTAHADSAYEQNVPSHAVTMTPVGGTSPYTYLWANETGDAVSFSTPTLATTVFYASLFNETITGTVLGTVTDFLGNTATVSVAFALTHNVV